MPHTAFNRRHFLSLAGTAALYASLPGWARATTASAEAGSGSAIEPPKRLVRFPQKTDLILLTDRPPLLETPLHYFRQDLTPNEAFFVRWHLGGYPTRVDLSQFRLKVDGNVQNPLALTMDELVRGFEPVELIALNQCSGNARGRFEPKVPGGQWQYGGMGNARWTGVRLKDLLAKAGARAGAVEVSLAGLDESPMPGLPKYVKSLKFDHANDGEVMVAYAMNGAPLPMLNGFPLRLVVPGWYATYWVKSLAHITVLDQPLHNLWMDKAYRIPNNPQITESEEHLATDTVPINRFAIHSLFVRPEPQEVLHAGRPYTLEGLAMDSGYGITRVEVSTDGGKSWVDAQLDADLGRYSWRRWRLRWTPQVRGAYVLKVRATNRQGEQQLVEQWNHGGYARRVIESTAGMVV